MPRACDRASALAALVSLACFAWSSTSAAQSKEACADAANGAQTLRDGGRYIASRARLVTCSSDACPALVRDACRQWLSQLDAELPTVIFVVKDDKGHERTDVRVSVDGAPLLERLGGTPVPMDPGEHVVRAQAEGLASREVRVVLHAREKDRVIGVELPSLEPPAPAPKTGAAEGAPPAANTARTVATVGLAVLAVGAAAAGFAFVARSHDEANLAASLRQGIASRSGCAGVSSPACGQLSDAVAAQHRDANVSTASWVAAGGLALGAAVVWLLWPSADHGKTSGWIAPVIADGGLAVHVGGAFR